MKIIQIIPTLGSGGAERFTVDLSNELGKEDNKVILCTLYNLEDKKEYSFFRKEVKPNIKLINYSKKLGFDYTLFIKLFNLIKKEKPDIVHSHLSTLNYLFLSILFFRNVKFVHTLHSEATKLVKNKGEYWIRKFLYTKNLVVPVCISEESFMSYCKLYKKDNAEVIYNGRAIMKENEKQLNVIPDKKYFKNIFLHVGRYDEAKNQVNLVKAFNNILKIYPDELLLIIGGGDEKIKNDLKKYENNNIRLIGKVNNVNDFMQASDVFLLPSIFEGMPISLIEAFSNKLVSIVTPVGGMKNMITSMKNGMFFLDGTVTAIEKGIIEYLNLDEEIKLRLKKKAYIDFKEKYSIKMSANQYINIYSKI